MPGPLGRAVLLLVALLLLLPTIAYPETPETPDATDVKVECVVLLHGLGRTARSMGKLEAALKAEGYLTWNRGYPSTKHDIKTLSEEHVSPAVAYCLEHGAARVHFVTHSLGGILVRQYLADHKLERAGRIVMISPPNQGSEVADVLQKYRLFRWLIGPAMSELGTDAAGVPLSLPVPEPETGVIAGSRTSDPWFSPMIPGPDDGKVSVERTQFEGMEDFLVVRHGHTFIMRAPDVIEQVLHFLKNGTFVHEETEPKPSGNN